MKGKGKQRDAFILYKSHYEPISGLTDEQLGRLFRAIFQWQINGKAEPGPDIAIAFGFIINQCRVDNDKYLERCNKNRENIQTRWERDKNNTTVFNRIQSNTKHTDKEKEKGNGNGKVITDINDVYKD